MEATHDAGETSRLIRGNGEHPGEGTHDAGEIISSHHGHVRDTRG